MAETVLQVENLWKQYRLGVIGTGTLREDFARFWAKLRGKEDPTLKLGQSNTLHSQEGDYVWALQDINFEVRRGEVLGIIGKNGAGKSTLLKILSKVTAPSRGQVKVKGRIASLLEVGTGFHPELTGRENIFLNGAILGMTKNDIRAKFDEIVDFSGVGKYIDTPVKRYSSGMYVRLAFAVAAHLEPEILIVDEVLAVGDAEFQKKCLGKMKDVSGEGRTVLFVSHNMAAVQTLCSRGVLMEQGKAKLESDDIQSVISNYLQGNQSQEASYKADFASSRPHLVTCKINTSEGGTIQKHGHAISFEFLLYTPEPLLTASFSFIITDHIDNNIVHLWTFDSEQAMCRQEGFTRLVCTIPALKIYMGTYSLNTYFGSARDNIVYESLDGLCTFEVVMEKSRGEYTWEPNTCKYIEEAQWEVSNNVNHHQYNAAQKES